VVYVPDLVAEARDTSAPASTTVGISADQRFRRIAGLLVVVDVLCLAGALVAAHWLRFGFLPGGVHLIAAVIVASVLWVGVFHALGLYRPDHLSRPEEFRRTISAVGIGIVLIIVLTFWFEVYLSRSWIALTLLIAIVTELMARGFVRAHVARLKARGSLVLRTVVVGSGEYATDLAQALDADGSGFRSVAHIDAGDPLLTPDELSGIERVERVRAILRDHSPDCVFVASPEISQGAMFTVVQAARQEGVVIRVYTPLSGIMPSRLTPQPIGKAGVALTLRPAKLSTLQRIVKRAMDLVLAGIGLIIASPILIAAGLAVRCTSRGPVLFRQQRITQGGRTFSMYKFRTMSNGAERYFEEHSIDTSIPFFKLKSDPRITKVGGWLRRWSIDELPQLFNVLLGDMSLVGPRPLPAEQVSAHQELLGPRHEMRTGVTGWWQIQGRSDVDSEEAIRMDLYYIDNWSAALDLYILLRTIGVLLKRQGAY
jgi:exopolysaccharide biosynthesis polyprenyl glycosylphosphotransferase